MVGQQMELVQDPEIEMLSAAYTRMTTLCHTKCILTKYKDGEMAKGEALCTDCKSACPLLLVC